MKTFTNYLWKISRSYFVIYYFLPFFVLGFIPLMIIAFMMDMIEKPDHTPFCWFFYVLATACFALQTTWQIF